MSTPRTTPRVKGNLLMELDGREEPQTPPLTKFTWGLDLSGQNGNAPPWQGGVSESPAGLHGAGGTLDTTRAAERPGRSPWTPSTAACQGRIGGLLAMVDTKGTSSETDDGHLIYFYDGTLDPTRAAERPWAKPVDSVHRDGSRANGNVGQVIDARAGSPYYGHAVAKYEYYPFGGLLTSSVIRNSSGPKNPFLFSTKYRDSETGLYYSGYRYLLPRLGRWLNRDPIGERGGSNLYLALLNNPVGTIDPHGLLSPEGCPLCGSHNMPHRCPYSLPPSHRSQNSTAVPIRKPRSWSLGCTARWMTPDPITVLSADITIDSMKSDPDYYSDDARDAYFEFDEYGPPMPWSVDIRGTFSASLAIKGRVCCQCTASRAAGSSFGLSWGGEVEANVVVRVPFFVRVHPPAQIAAALVGGNIGWIYKGVRIATAYGNFANAATDVFGGLARLEEVSADGLCASLLIGKNHVSSEIVLPEVRRDDFLMLIGVEPVP